MNEKTQDLASVVETQYQDILNYKRQMQFLSKWAEFERFYAGDQWPAPTDRTRTLPRPVFNLVQRIADHKVASVMSENIKMVFSAMDVIDEGAFETEGADTFTRYSETTWELIKQDSLNEDVLQTASVTGTGILHYYFDANKTGGNHVKYAGEICGEEIDPVNFFPGNPQNRYVQKQPYIIITSRELVADVRKEAERNGIEKEKIAMIHEDNDTTDQAYDMAQHEVRGTGKVTVLTKYWKENGTVHFVKVASGVVFKPKTNTRLKQYPIALMQWRKRKKSLFGVGDVEGMIPNQKSINFLIAMQILSVQNTGWPKMLVKPGSLKKNPTNTPGEILFDMSPGDTWGVKYLEPGPITPVAGALVNELMEYTKEVSGANENALGEQVSAQLNATAIMMLQKAASVPIESIKRRFYQFVEDIGRIWEDMWKVYFNTERHITVKNDDHEEEVKPFTGTDYQDVEMHLKIDIGPSSSYSESLMMSSLDRFLDLQLIDFEQYLTYVPKNVVPFKDRLLKQVQKQNEIRRQQMMMQAQQPQDPTPEQTELSAELAALYEESPESLKRQIDQMMQQGMSNREIMEALAQMA